VVGNGLRCWRTHRHGALSEVERCRPWIEAALDYNGGTHVWADIVAGIESGKMQLWPAPKAALVTEIIKYPRKQVLNVFLGGGDLDQIMDMQPSVMAWAKAQGCEALHMSGRLGWTRTLPKYGWRTLYATMEKEI
jgi:hypothetical protein